MEIKYLKIYGDLIRNAQNLDDKDFGQIVRAMWTYSDTGEEPQLEGGAYYVWPFFRAHADACIERSKTNQSNAGNGAKTEQTEAKPSGPERTEANESKRKQTKANGSESERTGANVSEVERIEAKPSEAEQTEANESESAKNTDTVHVHKTYNKIHIQGQDTCINNHSQQQNARARDPAEDTHMAMAQWPPGEHDPGATADSIIQAARDAGIIHSRQDAAAMGEIIRHYPPHWVMASIQQCTRNHAKTLKYMYAVLKGFQEAGDIDTYKTHQEQAQTKTKQVIEQLYDQRPNTESDGTGTPEWIRQYMPELHLATG